MEKDIKENKMGELHKALFEVQKELEPVVKKKNNPFFQSKYADLEAVAEATLPLLNKNGLLLLQTTFLGVDGLTPMLRTELIHMTSGEIAKSEIPIITKDSTDPQKVIAGMTYMRRASITTICGLVTADDDGNASAKPSEKKLSPLKELKTGDAPKGKEEKIKILGVTKNTKTGIFTVATESGEMLTKEEVIAVLARSNIGKSPVLQYTVNNDMETVLLDVIP